MPVRIYVRLLGEGTEVWRPVDATHEGADRYRIVSENFDPNDECWEFPTGQLVKCEQRSFSDGIRGLAAIVKV